MFSFQFSAHQNALKIPGNLFEENNISAIANFVSISYIINMKKSMIGNNPRINFTWALEAKTAYSINFHYLKPGATHLSKKFKKSQK